MNSENTNAATKPTPTPISTRTLDSGLVEVAYRNRTEILIPINVPGGEALPLDAEIVYAVGTQVANVVLVGMLGGGMPGELTSGIYNALNAAVGAADAMRADLRPLRAALQRLVDDVDSRILLRATPVSPTAN